MLHSAQVQPKPKSKFPAKHWSETHAATQILDIGSVGFSVDIKWRPGIHCIAQSGDKCRLGSWVFICLPGVSPKSILREQSSLQHPQNDFVASRITELLTPDTGPTRDGGLVTVEVFKVGQELHPQFEMPILTRSEPAEFITVNSKVK
jgi:hypothetical protein